MKNLNVMILTAGLILGASVTVAQANETNSEKMNATGNDVKRGVKKGAHRVKEAVCLKGDLKCAGQKVKHRAEEAKDATVDKVKKVKGQVD